MLDKISELLRTKAELVADINGANEELSVVKSQFRDKKEQFIEEINNIYPEIE